MENEEGFLKNLAMWSHSRGTIQYDILCILILAFIFLMPSSCFVKAQNASTAQCSRPNAPSVAFFGNAIPVARQGQPNVANPVTKP
jgi:hypothetical protein